MKIKHIHDKLFGINYVLAYNIQGDEDIDFLKEKLGKLFGSKIGLDYLHSSTEGYCNIFNTKKGTLVVIILDKFDNSNYYKGVLAHECFHATKFALESRGINFCEETEEVFSYNIQMLIENFLDQKKKPRSSIIKPKIKLKKYVSIGKRQIAKAASR